MNHSRGLEQFGRHFGDGRSDVELTRRPLSAGYLFLNEHLTAKNDLSLLLFNTMLKAGFRFG